MNATIPHVLGSKLIGEVESVKAVEAAALPQLGDLAKGICDRSGNALVAAGVGELDADADDTAALNGTAPVAPLVADVPVTLTVSVPADEPTVSEASAKKKK